MNQQRYLSVYRLHLIDHSWLGATGDACVDGIISVHSSVTNNILVKKNKAYFISKVIYVLIKTRESNLTSVDEHNDNKTKM